MNKPTERNQGYCKFIKKVNHTWIFLVGKHKGEALSKFKHGSYLKWALKSVKLAKNEKFAISRILNLKRKYENPVQNVLKSEENHTLALGKCKGKHITQVDYDYLNILTTAVNMPPNQLHIIKKELERRIESLNQAPSLDWI